MNNLIYKKFYLLLFLIMLWQLFSTKDEKNIISYCVTEIGRVTAIDRNATSDNEAKDLDKEVFYFGQVNEQDNDAIPLWGAKVASLAVVVLALSILIFLLRKFWRKLK